jgi:hypothetical protein
VWGVGVGVSIYRAGNVLLRGIWRRAGCVCVGHVAVGVANGFRLHKTNCLVGLDRSLLAPYPTPSDFGHLGHNAGHVRAVPLSAFMLTSGQRTCA